VKGLMMLHSKNNDRYPDYPESYTTFAGKKSEEDASLHRAIYCPKCGSDWHTKASKDSNDEQRMKCKRCNHRFHVASHFKDSAELFRILFFYQKGYSATKIAKELEIHTSTVTKCIDKYQPFIEQLLARDINEIE